MSGEHTKYDAIVIGGGAMGNSTAFHLSKRRVRTLLLEQFTFFNQLGSSAGVSRQFRIPYPEEYMVQMVQESPFRSGMSCRSWRSRRSGCGTT